MADDPDRVPDDGRGLGNEWVIYDVGGSRTTVSLLPPLASDIH
jgi:hypothetical protein